MFKPKITPFWNQSLVEGYTKMGSIDINPFDGMGPSLGFIHIQASFWFFNVKLAWEIKK